MKAARTRMKRADSSWNAESSIGLCVLIGLGWCGRSHLDAERLGGRLVDDLSTVGDGRALRDLVVQVDLELAVGDEMLDQGVEVLGVHLGRASGHGGREVRVPDDQDAVLDDLLVGL